MPSIGRGRRSGLQGDVMSLYRAILRTAKTKDSATVVFAREKFRADARSIKRIDFGKIEFLLRQGHKRLKLLRMPGTMAAANISASSPPGSRAFSTSTRSSSRSSAPMLAYDSPERPRVHVVSLGCGRNWVDSEVMLGSFLKAGYEIEPSDPARASLMVVNTCGFLGVARDEADKEIKRLAAVKAGRAEKGLGASLVVTGCMVNLEKEAVLARHPAIDHLVGASGIERVLDAVASGQRLLAIPTSPRDAARAAAAASEQPSTERSTERSHLESDDGDGNDGGSDGSRGGARDEVAALAAAAAAARASLAVGEPPLPVIGARVLATPPHTAYLKVAEGCRKSCTFCIIPVIKGPLRSKPPAQVARELRALVAGGVREVSIIAQDLGDFGKDAAKGAAKGLAAGKDEDDDGGETTGLSGSQRLVSLLESLVEAVRTDEGNRGTERGSTGGSSSTAAFPAAWLRLLYLYPDEIDASVLRLLGASGGALAPYVDMPLQHVSSSVLKRMGRKALYDRSALEATLTGLQAVRCDSWATPCGATLAPFGGVAVRTTLMVGFPGETEADFQELLAFVREWGPTHLHHVGVFEFSAEPSARASAFAAQVPPAVKRRRRVQLEAAHARNVAKRHRRLVGAEVVVLVDHALGAKDAHVVQVSTPSPSARQLLAVGRHPGQALSVDGVVRLLAPPVGVDSDSFAVPEAGELWAARVEATEHASSDLAATLLRPIKWGTPCGKLAK